MPWVAADAQKHTKKADTPKKQQGWAKAANARLKTCMADGGDQDECEASAIKVANAAVSKSEETAEVLVRVPLLAVPVDGETVPVSDLIDAYRQMQEGKSESKPEDRPLPAGEFDFREAVSGSLEDFAMSVKDAFRAAFKSDMVSSTGVPVDDLWPREVFKDNPSLDDAVVVRANGAFYAVEYKQNDDGGFDFATREKWHKVVLTYTFAEEPAEEMAEVELAESASGAALQLAEALPAADGNRAPLLLDVALIRPGWGNKTDNHYYPAEMLKRDAKVFEGVKMYTTNHREGEKSVRTEVSQVQEIIGFTDDGAPIAKVAIHDPDFAEATRNRARLNTLTSLECSILARGRVKTRKVDGKQANVVEAITSAQSVDWVTRGGAGGHALNLAETADGGNDMSDKEKQEQEKQEEKAPVTETQEAVLSEAGQEKQEAPKPLDGDAVEGFLKASTLPEAAQKRLAEAEYKDKAEVETAITAEVAYLKTITGSGKPFGQGRGKPPDETRISEADVQKGFDAIDRQHGLYVAEGAE
jgi:hypothetical protein